MSTKNNKAKVQYTKFFIFVFFIIVILVGAFMFRNMNKSKKTTPSNNNNKQQTTSSTTSGIKYVDNDKNDGKVVQKGVVKIPESELPKPEKIKTPDVAKIDKKSLEVKPIIVDETNIH